MPIDDDSLRKIRQRQARYAEEGKAIQGNGDLSTTGKRKSLAVTRHRALGDIQRIKDAANAAYSTRRRQLEDQLFSIKDIPSDVTAAMSYRDAEDRVAQIKTGHEAQLMMRRALRSGDGLLARALFSRGWDLAGDKMTGSGWGEVCKAYIADMRPDLAPVADELETLQAAGSRTARMREQMETDVFMPPELSGMSPADRQQAVTGAAAEQGSETA